MGVPLFFSWLMRNNKLNRCVSKQKPQKVDILALDLNGIIHTSIGEIMKYYDHMNKEAKEHVFRDILGKINTVVSRTKPKESLIVAIDSVVPMAKIKQQRNRRFLARKDDPSPKFDTNSISPGTDFMVELDKFLKKEFERIILNKKDSFNNRDLLNINERFFPDKIIYSSHLVPGEGEHKIIELVKKGAHKNKSLMVHGADADLIFINLLLLRQNFDNIYILRETNNGRFETMNFIDIRILYETIKKLIKTSYPIQDFTLAFMICGNDFIPHFLEFQDVSRFLDLVFNTLLTFKEPLTTLNSIEWIQLDKFLNEINKSYDHMLEMWGKNQSINRQLSENVDFLQTYINEKKNYKGFRNMYYYRVFFFDLDPNKEIDADKYQDEIDELCKTYLQSIDWAFRYYSLGVDSINKKWYYPFNYAPLFPDILKYLEKNKSNSFSWTVSSRFGPHSFPQVYEQLSIILPRESAIISPKKLYPLYNSNSPLREIYPKNFQVDNMGKVRFQETILLPFPDISKVSLVVKALGGPMKYTNNKIYAFLRPKI